MKAPTQEKEKIMNVAKQALLLLKENRLLRDESRLLRDRISDVLSLILV